jgi:hypothetical protein
MAAQRFHRCRAVSNYRAEHSKGAPLVLKISGFASEKDAKDFASMLMHSLRWASLRCGHSISPSSTEPNVSEGKMFDGSRPTVFSTNLNALPYHMSASVVEGLHLAVLSGYINEALADSIPKKLAADTALGLALELFADVEFAGATNSQFVVLFTALEVLVPKATSRGKRGAVVGMVKKALLNAGHANPKSIAKQLDELYVTRNDLMHEAKTVRSSELDELRAIVRDTLVALISKA